MIFIKVVVFILGIYLSMRMIAAMYGIIDYWYTIKTAYPVVIKRIVGWSVITLFLIILLGNYRQAFLWGMLSYGFIFLISYFPAKLLLMRDVRLTDINQKASRRI